MAEIIKGLKALTTTLEEILRGSDRVAQLQGEQRRITDQIDGEVADIRAKCREVKRFLEGESAENGPQEKAIGELINTAKLPKSEPRQMYERVKALIEATADPEGIAFPDIVASYQKIKWRDWNDEELPKKIRDAIKNLRKQLKERLSHTGERGGKYMIT